jgi:single-stranded DNA-binding protein
LKEPGSAGLFALGFRVIAVKVAADRREDRPKTEQLGMRVFVAGKLVQRSFEVEGQNRTTVEIQVQHVGPDLQFATATVEKATAEAKAL